MSEIHQFLEYIQPDIYLDLVGVIIIALNQKGEITILNKKGNEILEYEDGELIGLNWFDKCIPSRFRAKVFKVFQKIMHGEKELVEFFENPVLTKNGEEKIIAWHNTIIYDDNMNIIGTLSSGEDISQRKQAEKELKNHQATLESIFISTPTGISVVINHVITQVNTRFCTIVGYSQDELLGRSIRIVYPTDEDYRYVERIKDIQIQNHGIAIIETRFLRKDGTIIDILLNSAPINPYDLSAGITYTALDITHRKKVEENLKKSEEKYRLLAENLNDLVTVVNEAGGIEYINEKTHKKVMGYSYKDIEHKNVFELVHPEDRKKVSEVMRRTFKEKEGFVEARIAHKDGHYIWTETNGKTFVNNDGKVKILMITRDITKRKIAEEEYKKNEKFLENIFDGMQDGLSILDKDLNIIRVNYWIQEMYGREGGLIGKKCYDVYQRRESPCPWCPSLLTLESGQKHNSIVPYPIEEEPSGWIELTSFPLKQQDNNVIGVIEYVKDITDRVIANIKLKKSEEKYRNAYNRINLYRDVFSHDINNIMQNILTSVELVKLFSGDPNRKQSLEEITNLIYEQVIRGKMLVANVQELSKTDEIISNLLPINAYQILIASFDSVKKNFIQKKIDIKVDSVQKNYVVKANELLKDVFVNILTNAIQHNNKPFVKILIKISKEKSNEIQYIKFEFIDNGIGIPDSMKELIFSREYKKEGFPSGIGLGLLLVKRIFDSYKAKIRVEDRVKGDFSKGSNFILTIPEAI
ncbi:MAG: PAS domain S-box protein [Candidatus Odinarchaeota archaeon]